MVQSEIHVYFYLLVTGMTLRVSRANGWFCVKNYLSADKWQVC